MPRILIADTYYPEVIRALPVRTRGAYEVELANVLGFSFGTADFYSRGLRRCGWDAVDVVLNHDGLQELWAREHGVGPGGDVFDAQLRYYDPDVVLMQDLSVPLKRKPRLLAGQCSCAMPPAENLCAYDVIFTSFPHYVHEFERLGVRGVFNALAFDPIVIERDPKHPSRDLDVVFVGGVGAASHWRTGTATLEAIAAAVPSFAWWGYGLDRLASASPLRACYQGEAWGREMYRILRRAKIVINRHGEVAAGFANNMRLFEATGCGALLLTETAPNLPEYFTVGEEIDVYHSAERAIDLIRFYLKRAEPRALTAIRGQRRTLAEHTYGQRMQKISTTLEGMLA